VGWREKRVNNLKFPVLTAAFWVKIVAKIATRSDVKLRKN
jgi:hypothetical protein